MGLLDLFGNTNGFDAANAANAANKQLYGNIQAPIFQNYTPEQLSNITANYQTVQQNPLLQSAQLSALAKMSGLADTGLTAADQAGYQQARDIVERLIGANQ